MRQGNVMMMILVLLTVVCTTTGDGSDHAAKEVMCIPMGDILLTAPKNVEAKRSPVAFPHSSHFLFECKTCHHEWNGNDHIQSCIASGCHDLTTMPQKTEKGDTENSAYKYYKTAFHTMCIGCHKGIQTKNTELEKSGVILEENLQSPGPTGCVGCHPKNQ